MKSGWDVSPFEVLSEYCMETERIKRERKFSKCEDSYPSSKSKPDQIKLCLSSSHEELSFHQCFIIPNLKYSVLKAVQ